MAGAIGQSIGGFLGAAHGTFAGLSELNEGRQLATRYLQNYRPADFTSAGLSGTYKDNVFSLTRTPETAGRVAGLDVAANRTLSGLQAIGQQYRPGFSELRASRLSGVESARRRAVGNLRENLQRRRVLGSSFAQDAVTRAELGFQQEADRVRAETYLQELQVTQQNILQQNEVDTNRQLAQLNQLNLESNISATYAGQISQINAQNTQLMSQLTAELYAARAGLWANWQQAHLQMLQSGTSTLAGTSFGGSPLQGSATSGAFAGGIGGLL